MHPSDRSQPPDPRAAATITDLLGSLRRLRAWAGMPTYREIAERVARQHPAVGGVAGRPAISTVADYFLKTDRARLDYDLFFALVRALDPSDQRASGWHEAWQAVFAPAGGDVVAAGAALPDRVAGFTGRAGELREVSDPPGGARITVITGMAGVGKTALAVHAGWELRRRDPGVALCVDLAGFHPGLAPAEPSGVLAAFLRLLAGPGARIPSGHAARRRMYSRLLEDKPGVVILDNAADLAQIMPLLPDSPTVRAIVTSRVRLSVPAAQHIRLGTLPGDDATRLLGHLTDPARVAAEPHAATRIAECCGHLPLALSLVARQVNAKPDWTLADHAARLTELGLDDGVRAALALSYRSLTVTQATLLRRLAINPGMEFDGNAAAALLGVDPETGSAVLADLDRASLIHPQGDEHRYGMHDLVRAFARERAVDDDAASERRAAVHRLMDYYRQALDAPRLVRQRDG